jgi:predicted short-subunit dehydrogenase-like oxidoreductase (DUF2520 family)
MSHESLRAATGLNSTRGLPADALDEVVRTVELLNTKIDDVTLSGRFDSMTPVSRKDLAKMDSQLQALAKIVESHDVHFMNWLGDLKNQTSRLRDRVYTLESNQ